MKYFHFTTKPGGLVGIDTAESGGRAGSESCIIILMLTKPKKKPSVSQLKKKADGVFSQFIRLRYADRHTGYAQCVTCPLSKPWKEQQCGHYETRGANILRYDERNAHVQCIGCNVFKKGNYPAYARFMLKTYGPTILDELAGEAKELKQFKTHQLIEIIEEYKAKIKGLTDIA